MNERLCLVEDDPTILELVSRKLRSEGYRVDVFDRVEELISDESAYAKWDLFILDVLLHGRSEGLDLCESLRKHSPTLPILILSALSDPADRIEGLRMGADDYLGKPFEMEELLLRVRGMLQRRSWYGVLPRNDSLFAWGDCRVDFLKLEGERGKERFPLTQKECMLLKLLIEREGEVVRRDEILNQVWGYDAFPSSRTVDNFILRLRKLFEEVPGNPKYIQSVRGMGYKFTP